MKVRLDKDGNFFLIPQTDIEHDAMHKLFSGIRQHEVQAVLRWNNQGVVIDAGQGSAAGSPQEEVCDHPFTRLHRESGDCDTVYCKCGWKSSMNRKGSDYKGVPFQPAP